MIREGASIIIRVDAVVVVVELAFAAHLYSIPGASKFVLAMLLMGQSICNLERQ